MSDVIGVRFKKAGKVSYFAPGEEEFAVGDGVIVETVRGVEFGTVVVGRKTVDDSELTKPLRGVKKKADEHDYAVIEENRRLEKQAFDICRQKIEKHNLEMKLINVEYTFDASKIVFHFTAEGRVDFRELVKDLAGVFKTRIELRQIGVRDETKMLGGLGPCGRPACCSAFLGDFQPVSIKMAKEQNLSLSPTKISGLCGRLMCCLNYEHEYYEELQKVLPRVGSDVKTPDGVGTVIGQSSLKQLVRVRIVTEDGTAEAREYSVDDVTPEPKKKREKQPEKSEKQKKDKEKEKNNDVQEGQEPQEEKAQAAE